MLIGDEGVGKSWLNEAMCGVHFMKRGRARYNNGEELDEGFAFACTKQGFGPPVELWFAGESKDAEDERLRRLFYDCAIDIAFILFSLTSPESLRKAQTQWIQDARRYTQHSTRLFLVGVDKRVPGDSIIEEAFQERSLSLVPHEDALEVSKRESLVGYFPFQSTEDCATIVINVLSCLNPEYQRHRYHREAKKACAIA